MLALGQRERACLWKYFQLCLQRRAALSGDSSPIAGAHARSAKGKGGGGKGEARASPNASAAADMNLAEDFPTLGKMEFPSLGGEEGGSAVAEVMNNTWGKPKQVVPRIVPSTPQMKDAWDDESPAAYFPALEQFPTLGGKANSNASAAAASWRPPAAAAVRPPKPTVKAVPKPPSAGDFPALGGASSASASAARWAQNRERAEQAKPEPAKPKAPEPPKDFDMKEELFPGLPSAPSAKTKPSAKAKGGVKAKAPATAKAKAEAEAKAAAAKREEEFAAAVAKSRGSQLWSWCRRSAGPHTQPA